MRNPYNPPQQSPLAESRRIAPPKRGVSRNTHYRRSMYQRCGTVKPHNGKGRQRLTVGEPKREAKAVALMLPSPSGAHQPSQRASQAEHRGFSPVQTSQSTRFQTTGVAPEDGDVV